MLRAMARQELQVKVPVGPVVLAAWRAVFGRLGAVLELGWLPLLAMLAALLLPGLATRYLGTGESVSATTVMLDPGDLVDAAIAILCLNAFAVRWHQLMLFGGPLAVPRRQFGRAWARFTLYSLIAYGLFVGLILLIGLGWRLPFGYDGSDVSYLVEANVAAALTLAISLAITRLSLLLPAAARSDRLGLADAWRAMRGNTWRLLAASVLAVAPVVLLTSILFGRLLAAAHIGSLEALTQDPPLGVFLLNAVLEVVLRLLLVALGASILSDFYRRLMSRQQ
jgi:hypothetical protein